MGETAMSDGGFEAYVRGNEVERQRYLTLRTTLAEFVNLFRGRRVLDYGASYSLSMCALIALGAGDVIGVEPDDNRVRRGQGILRDLGYSSRATLSHVPDTTRLPLADGAVEVVIANAVLEHIPQPRGAYIAEMWRVLAPGGHLIINETPNKYLPVDFHTTKLALVPWLPSGLARRY